MLILLAFATIWFAVTQSWALGVVVTCIWIVAAIAIDIWQNPQLKNRW